MLKRSLLVSTAVDVLILVVVASAARPEQSAPSRPFDGRLYAAVSRWDAPALDPVGEGARVAPALRPRFERFARCLASFESRLPEASEFFARAAQNQRRVLERALACSIEAPDASNLAAAYAGQATLLYEWEGLHTAPLDEAVYAEQFIRARPSSPLVPFLHVFAAGRVRCAFEILDGALDDREVVSLARRYVTHLEHAGARAPLVRLIANDLDAMAFLCRNVAKHPRAARR